MGDFYLDTSIRMLRRDNRGTGVRESTDGIYVDATIRNGECRLGFVVRRNGVTSVFSTAGRVTKSHAAEAEAVRIASAIYPGARVFTDCIDTSRQEKCFHVPRELNRDAHNAARKAANYIPRSEIERLAKLIPSRSLLFTCME